MLPDVTRFTNLAECRIANQLMRRLVLPNHDLDSIRLDISMRLGDLEARLENLCHKTETTK